MAPKVAPCKPRLLVLLSQHIMRCAADAGAATALWDQATDLNFSKRSCEPYDSDGR